MRMYDIISKKRDGSKLCEAELKFIVDGFTSGTIPDYQMSAFLMAVYFNSMTKAELALFTKFMAHSGDIVNLSAIDGIKADKHSTGGVGDKTTLIVAPIVASCGVKVAKMSGRGLGHTGGTIDKLEAIPGFITELSQARFHKQVNEIGISVIGQSGNLAPADKKIYALRDVTATVPSIPLIASSIMSKKLASGSDCILLDVKCGDGAFMKTLDDAVLLARAMVDIGEENNRCTAALITDMNTPLGREVGNANEVLEAVTVLLGLECTPELYPADLYNVCIELSAHMLSLAGKGTAEECRCMAKKAVESKAALEKLYEMVRAQGGDVRALTGEIKITGAKEVYCLQSKQDGYVKAINAEKVGIAAMILGAGRETKESLIDYSAGITLYAKPGDVVIKGGTIAALYTNKSEKLNEAHELLYSAFEFCSEIPPQKPLILAHVDKNGVTVY